MSEKITNGNPKVFISYSWDNDEHREWVMAFTNELRKNGVDADIDEFNTQIETVNLNRMMIENIKNSDYIITVLTDQYAKKADCFQGGVGYETNLLISEINDNPKKLIPIIRYNGEPNDTIPFYAKGLSYINFSSDNKYLEKFEELLFKIFRKERIEKEPLGEIPKLTSRKITMGNAKNSHNGVVELQEEQKYEENKLDSINKKATSGANESIISKSKQLSKKGSREINTKKDSQNMFFNILYFILVCGTCLIAISCSDNINKFYVGFVTVIVPSCVLLLLEVKSEHPNKFKILFNVKASTIGCIFSCFGMVPCIVALFESEKVRNLFYFPPDITTILGNVLSVPFAIYVVYAFATNQKIYEDFIDDKQSENVVKTYFAKIVAVVTTAICIFSLFYFNTVDRNNTWAQIDNKFTLTMYFNNIYILISLLTFVTGMIIVFERVFTAARYSKFGDFNIDIFKNLNKISLCICIFLSVWGINGIIPYEGYANSLTSPNKEMVYYATCGLYVISFMLLYFYLITKFSNESQINSTWKGNYYIVVHIFCILLYLCWQFYMGFASGRGGLNNILLNISVIIFTFLIIFTVVSYVIFHEIKNKKR